MSKPYPGSVPEFRYFKKKDGTIVFQVRYINTPLGYTGLWQDVQIIEE